MLVTNPVSNFYTSTYASYKGDVQSRKIDSYFETHEKVPIKVTELV
jgi:hypothetical protein